jgi:DinB family
MKPFIAPTKAALMEALDKNVATTRDAIAGAGDDHMGKIWTLSFGGHTIFALPRTAAFRNMVMSHLIHHRGQLSVYLRLLDVPIPGMYGPSADAQ